MIYLSDLIYTLPVMAAQTQKNPYKPGAGHMPPYLAGRDDERREFERLLEQDVILENLVLTGLRGVGKTVLLDALKPRAIRASWLWVGTDLSETSSLSEQNMAIRLLTDLSVVSSSVVVHREQLSRIGFAPQTQTVEYRLDYATLRALFEQTPGLVADKLKAVLEAVWQGLKASDVRGVIFAYDEAQTLADHAERHEHPLSLLLDVFQSIQKKGIPFMLVLAGLPTLFPTLVEARTLAERMFRVVFLDRLDAKDSYAAIQKPLVEAKSSVRFDDEAARTIFADSGGYPYFIQFICREAFDAFLQQAQQPGRGRRIPREEIVRKLDSDFFAGRWARATDRQRELLIVIAHLDNCDGEFTPQEIAAKSQRMDSKPFSSSHASQMLFALASAGLVYKNRHGKYSLAVPLLGRFIRRQVEPSG